MLLFTPFANAQIKGEQSIEVGGKIDLKIEGQWDLIFWITPEDIEFETFDNNIRLLGWTGSKEQTVYFTANVAKLDWDNKTVDEQQTLRHKVVIGKPTPPPPPIPPDPDLTGLAKDVFNWASAVDSTYRVKASALSQNYKSVADQLNNVELTIEQALDEIRKGNNEILNNQQAKDAWAVFGSRLQSAMSDSWPMNRVQFVTFLNSVALGLSKVE